jgi:hypothetical protein
MLLRSSFFSDSIIPSIPKNITRADAIIVTIERTAESIVIITIHLVLCVSNRDKIVV